MFFLLKIVVCESLLNKTLSKNHFFYNILLFVKIIIVKNRSVQPISGPPKFDRIRPV